MLPTHARAIARCLSQVAGGLHRREKASLRRASVQAMSLATERAYTASPPDCTRYNVSSLPIMEKDEQFLRVIGILLSYVATIKLAYKENIPCLNSINMLQ